MCRAAKRCVLVLFARFSRAPSFLRSDVRHRGGWATPPSALLRSCDASPRISLTHIPCMYPHDFLSRHASFLSLPFLPPASSLPHTMTSNMITGTFQYGTWCSPADGGIQSAAACMAAAADKGISYASEAGSDWHTGCILHGGAFFSSLEILLRNSFCLRSRGASLARLRHSLISPPLLLTTLPTP